MRFAALITNKIAESFGYTDISRPRMRLKARQRQNPPQRPKQNNKRQDNQTRSDAGRSKFLAQRRKQKHRRQRYGHPYILIRAFASLRTFFKHSRRFLI